MQHRKSSYSEEKYDTVYGTVDTEWDTEKRDVLINKPQ